MNRSFPAVRRRRFRAGLATKLLGALTIAVSAAPAAWAHEEFARREGLSCVACHAAPTGGTLTALGREYLWSGAGLDRESTTTGKDRLGHWSGEWTNWTRSFRERVVGESVSGISTVNDVRLHGEELAGVERLRFDGELLSRAVVTDGPEGFEDDEVRLLLGTLEYQREKAESAFVSADNGSRRAQRRVGWTGCRGRARCRGAFRWRPSADCRRRTRKRDLAAIYWSAVEPATATRAD